MNININVTVNLDLDYVEKIDLNECMNFITLLDQDYTVLENKDIFINEDTVGPYLKFKLNKSIKKLNGEKKNTCSVYYLELLLLDNIPKDSIGEQIIKIRNMIENTLKTEITTEKINEIFNTKIEIKIKNIEHIQFIKNLLTPIVIITNNKDFIDEINKCVNNENGIYLKLLVGLIINGHNSEKIFTKIKKSIKIDNRELEKLSCIQHDKNKNINIDNIADIREIIWSLLFFFIAKNYTEDFITGLNDECVNIFKIIQTFSDIYNKYVIMGDEYSHIVNEKISVPCTAAKTKNICDDLFKNTLLNCSDLIISEIDYRYFKNLKLFLNIFIQQFDSNFFEENNLVFKIDKLAQIGGYKEKYLKYKNKYIMLQKMLNNKKY